MPIHDIYSKRQKRLRGEVPDVYEYETIPSTLRVQVIYIWDEAYGSRISFTPDLHPFEHISRVLRREYGVFRLVDSYDSVYESVRKFLLMTREADEAIDVIELSFKYIDNEVHENPDSFPNRKMSPDDAIEELNFRFQEHGVGYRYESGQIIRIDSEWIHSEMVKPALKILADSMYKGANEEFRKAHEHYRAKRYAECMNECLKAFESCIKAICDDKGWAYDPRDRVMRLIDLVFDRGLIPKFMESHFTALRKTLQDGVPTVRNQLSAHGQGNEEVAPPDYMAAYTIHLTASNILLLARANGERK